MNDEILERAGGYMYDRKSNKFLISKQNLQLRNVNNRWITTSKDKKIKTN